MNSVSRIVALIAACASPPARAPTPAPVRAQNPSSCPATYRDAAGPCHSDRSCDFAEGSCLCAPYVPPAPCRGGAAMPREPIAEAPPPPPPPPPPPTWQCSPRLRPDGCPGGAPGNTACSTEGKTCNYGDCCFVTYTCTSGQWIVRPGGCPP